MTIPLKQLKSIKPIKTRLNMDMFFLGVRKFWIFFFKKSVFEHRNLNFRQISIKLWENIHIYMGFFDEGEKN